MWVRARVLSYLGSEIDIALISFIVLSGNLAHTCHCKKVNKTLCCVHF